MPQSQLLTIDALAKLRPYLYHLTATTNIPRIQEQRRLVSAATLFNEAGQPELITVRRPTHAQVVVQGAQVVIRDQAPLHAGNVALGSGWTFEDLVAALNALVFFWPGNADGPIAYGQRHFARYEHEQTSIVRVPLLDLVAANPNREVLVCKYNSGSPRCNAGKPSPRSAETFKGVNQSNLRPSQVIEVTFQGDVNLPTTSLVASSLNGPWGAL
jgi:hypothetical protein